MEQTPLSRFLKALAENRPLTFADLPDVKAILAATPYFTLPAAMMLRVDGLPEPEAAPLSAAVALNAPDLDTLCRLIGPADARLADFYPPEEQPETPSTETALDRFLDTYGTVSSTDRHEQQLLERLIFNPVPADYAQTLLADGEQPAEPLSEQDRMLDAFLSSQSQTAQQQAEPAKPQPRTEPVKVPTAAEAPLSESLAKIYIRQKRYDKAYEIISQLSLNNPKKSVYFADQLRFLRKLMLIQQYKKTSAKGRN